MLHNWIYRIVVILFGRKLHKMEQDKDILNNKIKILDAEIKQLKYRLNAKEWERKKYLQFYHNDSDNVTSHSSTWI